MLFRSLEREFGGGPVGLRPGGGGLMRPQVDRPRSYERGYAVRQKPFRSLEREFGVGPVGLRPGGGG